MASTKAREEYDAKGSNRCDLAQHHLQPRSTVVGEKKGRDSEQEPYENGLRPSSPVVRLADRIDLWVCEETGDARQTQGEQADNEFKRAVINF
jgi:hypothetical protein